MPKLKIFVSYKYKKPILANEIIVPIQTGRAIADEKFEGMIGDDTGDNISKENPRYNELSAQYWVWKNYEQIGNPEYVGFMHYRRQFIFDKKLKCLPFVWLPGTKFYYVKKIYKNYMSHFTPEKVMPYLEDKTDCISFCSLDIGPISKQNDMKSHFYKGMPAQKQEIFEVLEDVIVNQYPEYQKTFEEFKSGTRMYCCNSFIMPKDMFCEYSEFLFNVLGEVDKRVDSSEFNPAELRFLGFLGEYMLSIFLFHKKKNPDFKLKELPGTYVCDTYKDIKYNLIKSKIFIKLTKGKKYFHYAKKYLRYRKYVADVKV